MSDDKEPLSSGQRLDRDDARELLRLILEQLRALRAAVEREQEPQPAIPLSL